MTEAEKPTSPSAAERPKARAPRKTRGPYPKLKDASEDPEAKRLCRKIEPYDIAWFEEPTPIDVPDGLRQLRTATGIPIAAGESEQTRYSFRDLLEARAVRVLVEWIKKITDVELPVATEAKPGTPAIYIGKAAIQAGLKLDAAGPGAASSRDASLGA